MPDRFRRLTGPLGNVDDPTALVGYAVDVFHRCYGDVVVLAAVLGHRLDAGKHGRVVEGPLRLAVLTPDTIISADPRTGRSVGTRPVTDLVGYYADEDGRLLLRFDVPNDRFPLVAGFAPLVLYGEPELSARAVGFTVLRRFVDAWEEQTGQPFRNTWTGQRPHTEDD